MAEKTPPPTVEDPTPQPTEVGPARGLTDTEWAELRERRQLLTDWRVALSDAITVGTAAHPGDPDAAARFAAARVMDSVADAVDDAAGMLGDAAIERIGRRADAERVRRGRPRPGGAAR